VCRKPDNGDEYVDPPHSVAGDQSHFRTHCLFHKFRLIPCVS
jgi:hypothetical protein